jgi:large subunit ribosomal protein L3
MKKFMLGKKIGMTQVFSDDGLSIPVTVIQAGPCTVVQKKTIENDGYNALKVAFGDAKEKSLNKPQKGVFSKAGVSVRKYMKEFKVEDCDNYAIGQEIKVAEMFQAGDKIDVSGISKGKGFQGVIKRHGQTIGPLTHGSKYFRGPGSMGAGTSPGRVFKGKNLPGHMGAEKVTIQNLNIVRVDGERNLLLVKGAVPGPKGALLVIREAVKNAI